MPPQSTPEKTGYIETDKYGQLTEVIYTSRDELELNIESRAQTGFWSPDQKKHELDISPTGGYLVIKIHRLSIDSADTQWFRVVVRQGDKTIQDLNGKKSIAKVPFPRSNQWRNLMIVPLSQKLDTAFTCYVIDQIQNKRYEFLIQPKTDDRS